MSKLSIDQRLEIKELLATGKYTHQVIADQFGVHRTTVTDIKKWKGPKTKKSKTARVPFFKTKEEVSNDSKTKIETDFQKDKAVITTKSLNIRTLEDALREAKVDLTIWEVDRHKVNSWEVTMKLKNGEEDNPQTFTNYAVTVWLKRKTAEVLSLEQILQDIKRHSPIVSKIKQISTKCHKNKRELEISIMDPHFGMCCFTPQSDLTWSMDECESVVLDMLTRILERAAIHGPYEQIVFPFGNDFLHADNVFHTTTAGTAQPEMSSWHETFVRGEKLAIKMIEMMKQVAPVKLIVVPGNHARQTEFVLGRLLQAYYHNDKNIEFDATTSPHKYHHYGVNLIGFEHGHSVKPQIRLASLMSNECRDIWAQTSYREWHLGDQHRKGSSKPSTMEEQGVSVEFLPGLTPPNEWHRLKGYNWQKRAVMAFVWDKTAGPISRLQVNIDSYTGRVMV